MLSPKDYFLTDSSILYPHTTVKIVDFYEKNLASTMLTGGSNTLPLNLFQHVANEVKRSFEKAMDEGGKDCFVPIHLQRVRNTMYREEVIGVYKAWKNTGKIFQLNRHQDIIQAWESLELFMESHNFPHTTEKFPLNSAYYLCYDLHWCLLLDIIKTIVVPLSVSSSKKAISDILPLNIPTHQRGTPTSEEISSILIGLYPNEEELVSDILTWYKCIVEVANIYDSEEFREQISAIGKGNSFTHRDGFANTLGIAKRTLRDIFILSQGEKLTHENRRSAETYLEEAIIKTFEDIR